jgi:hypothetical protein
MQGMYRSVSFGTPNDRSRPGLVKYFSFLNICEAPLLVKVADWGSMLKKRYKIPGFTGRLLGSAWEHFANRTIPTKKADITDISIEQVTSFDERIDSFWEKASKLKNIMVVKDRKYLNWRYVAKPRNKYNIFIAKRQDDIVGYIVFYLEKNNRYRGLIIDLLTIPGEDYVGEALVSNAVARFKAEEASIIYCWMLRDTPYYRIFKKLGFMHRPSPSFCICIFDQNLSKEFMTNPSNWYFVAGDNDSV